MFFFSISCESDAKSYECDIFTCALVSSVPVSALCSSSNTVFSHQSSHRVTPIRTLRTQPTWVAEQVTVHFVNPRLATRAHSTAAEDACLFQAATGGEEIYLRQGDPFFQSHCGAMASSAVSSVQNMRDEAESHAETRTGAYIYYGDAASFHKREFRTRLRIASKCGDQHIEAMSNVCDGLRGDAFVAAQEVGFDDLCEIVDGRPCGIDTLIQPHARNGFSLD